jgi:AcrR family transcriptional regulator
MRRRAELVDQTRLRITEAAVQLHTTVGPSKTSISSVAEAAGVTRLTVYRHFADQDQLFAACMAHWVARNPAPEAAAWPEVPSLRDRARKALTETYVWYAEHGEELWPIYRDFGAMPRSTQEAMRRDADGRIGAMLGGEVSAGEAARTQRAIAGHLLSFWTWRSLVVEQGLSVPEAADLAVAFLIAATEVEGRPTA